MTDAELLIADVLEVLTELGEPCVVSNFVTSFDQATGQVMSNISESYNGFCAAYPFDVSEIDNKNILKTDVKVIINKIPQSPKVGSTVTFDGKNYKVIEVINTRAYNSDIVYECQCRL